jgi:hypothetical protein
MSRPRVFAIGLNKTGTTSLDAALGLLGYRTLHWGGPQARRRVRRAMAEGAPLLDHLDPAPEAVSDLEEVTHNFELADRQYPGSRFVFTVRDLGEWLDSRRRHVERNRRRKAEGAYEGRFLAIEPETWAAEYRRHDRRVRGYFAGRDDLLVLDVARTDDLWGALCGFLGLDVPDVPFPHANRQPEPEPQSGSRARSAQPAE